jgi:CRISPR-associated protein Csh2
MTDLTNRSEILFLYDIENANPNGDPNDENKPRIDEETGKNIVTDVRLKRTIRDYLKDIKGKTLFVEEKVYDDGTIQDGKTRAKDFGKDKKEIKEAVLEQCIDVRLFGATIPLEKDSITFTGPVQFKMGKSLHAVKTQHIKGTGAFAAKLGSKQKTFREEYILSYSLISFCGVINENAATHTNLIKKDVEMLKDALWSGTKGLISRSKFGQMPRLLMVINYKQPNFFIGDLDNLINLDNGSLRDEELRKPEDYKIEMDTLLDTIEKHLDKIENVEFITDSRMQYLRKGEAVELKNLEKFTEISL